MTVHVECEDPRVLAEHGCAEVRSDTFGWQPSQCRSASEWAERIGDGWQARLVFEDAEAAGTGLVDYRDRLGARVEFRSLGRTGEPNGRWVPVDRHKGTCAGLFLAGECRVAAPVEEPPADPAPVVERDMLQLLVEEWRIEASAAAGGRAVAFNEAADALAEVAGLARPVPAPSTERVPWWEAVGREVADCERVISVKWVEGDVPFAVTSTGETVIVGGDSAVEVLRDGGQS